MQSGSFARFRIYTGIILSAVIITLCAGYMGSVNMEKETMGK
jgi:hypothetical protein